MSLLRRKVEERSAKLRAELDLLLPTIAAREQELERLRLQAVHLDNRLSDAQKLLDKIDKMGLAELVVMCNTPCFQYDPDLFDRMGMESAR